ncbi:hypothetical protein F4780DRAFT_308090 [Xylariomycetidae sp. FL0641]|nr:hypothetical protein F4780DRAFT_308090 [Xylariomycetidae sp. FL0641]
MNSHSKEFLRIIGKNRDKDVKDHYDPFAVSHDLELRHATGKLFARFREEMLPPRSVPTDRGYWALFQVKRNQRSPRKAFIHTVPRTSFTDEIHHILSLNACATLRTWPEISNTYKVDINGRPSLLSACGVHHGEAFRPVLASQRDRYGLPKAFSEGPCFIITKNNRSTLTGIPFHRQIHPALCRAINGRPEEPALTTKPSWIRGERCTGNRQECPMASGERCSNASNPPSTLEQ